MGLFRDMYPTRVLASHHDFRELERRVEQAIQRGFVKEIPVHRRLREGQLAVIESERWFLDLESGEIYSLQAPWERGCGYWDAISAEELPRDSTQTQ
jgi:hypothetical protein